MILEGTFSRILVSTCLHFRLQVEALKMGCLEFKFKISARAFQEAPRASQERPRASQERPKSAPRAAKSTPRASKTHSSDAQDSSRSAAPYKNTGKLRKALKIDENNGSLSKNDQKLWIWFQKEHGQANRQGREFISLFKSTFKVIAGV